MISLMSCTVPSLEDHATVSYNSGGASALMLKYILKKKMFVFIYLLLYLYFIPTYIISAYYECLLFFCQDFQVHSYPGNA